MSEAMSMIRADEWMQVVLPLLMEGHIFRISPNGDSMFPFLLSDRDEAVLKAADARCLRRGDVVLFRRNNGAYILHRIHKVRPEGFYMVGDNEKNLEGPVAPGDIKAVAVAMIRNGKQFSVRNKVYRFLSGTWMCMRPFRLKIVKLRKRIYKKYHI